MLGVSYIFHSHNMYAKYPVYPMVVKHRISPKRANNPM